MTNPPSKRTRREAARRAAQRRQRIRWAALAVAVVVGISAFLTFSGGSGDQAGALAPDFELETLDGETVRLSDYRDQPVALTFMHTY